MGYHIIIDEETGRYGLDVKAMEKNGWEVKRPAKKTRYSK
jgi:hypothetical protein